MTDRVASADAREEWGTIAQAAEALQVSPKTIRRMIARGEIDGRRLGKRLIRVRLDTLTEAAVPLQYRGGAA